MDYVVRPLPGVTAQLARAERSVQDKFQRIASVLAMNPLPNPQFPVITEDWAEDGSKLYTYSDDDFPYAIQYVVFAPDEDTYGSVSIIDLVDLRNR